jgi:hypothetical protein
LHTTGTPIRASAAGSGSAPCTEAIITPSTCPAIAYCSIRSWLAVELAIISTSCLSAASISWLTPRMMPGKNWSSENTRVEGSGSTSAIELVRWVTRLRAAWLGT